MPYLCSAIGLWWNGNTADSGPAFPGSSPGSPTVKRKGCAEEVQLFSNTQTRNLFVNKMDDYHADNYIA